MDDYINDDGYFNFDCENQTGTLPECDDDDFTVYPTFQSACRARGLLDSDEESDKR